MSAAAKPTIEELRALIAHREAKPSRFATVVEAEQSSFLIRGTLARIDAIPPVETSAHLERETLASHTAWCVGCPNYYDSILETEI